MRKEVGTFARRTDSMTRLSANTTLSGTSDFPLGEPHIRNYGVDHRKKLFLSFFFYKTNYDSLTSCQLIQPLFWIQYIPTSKVVFAESIDPHQLYACYSYNCEITNAQVSFWRVFLANYQFPGVTRACKHSEVRKMRAGRLFGPEVEALTLHVCTGGASARRPCVSLRGLEWPKSLEYCAIYWKDIWIVQ